MQGNLDSIVSEPAVAEFVDKTAKNRNTKVEYKVVNGADHFFRGKLAEFGTIVDEYIKESLSEEDSRNSDLNIQEGAKMVLLD